MKKKIENIKKIYSHPQAIAQCRNWILKNLPNAKIEEAESTAKAMQKAKLDKKSCAIGSAVSSEIYGLNILKEKIEDYEENITRFLVISREFSKENINSKTSILISSKDKVGALYDILLPFKENNVNLTRIESRPSKKKAWDYIFFFEFLGHRDDKNVKKTLREIEKQSSFFKILGSYTEEREI